MGLRAWSSTPPHRVTNITQTTNPTTARTTDMASAPKPKKGGYDAAKARQERAKIAQRISVKDSDFSFLWRPYAIPVHIRQHVRQVTGKVVDLLLYEGDAIDVSTYSDMWWISRLCVGEIGQNGRPVTREAVAAEFDDLFPGITIGDFVSTDANAEDDPPEA